MCVPYWWCTKHAQLIMGTWPIYKKTLPTTDLNKKKTFHLIKYLLATFIFFLSFQSVLVNVITQCDRGEDMGISYEFLESGLDASLLKKAFEKILTSSMCTRPDSIRKLVLLLEVGAPFDYAMKEGRGCAVDMYGYRPLHVLLDRLEERAFASAEIRVATEFALMAKNRSHCTNFLRAFFERATW